MPLGSDPAWINDQIQVEDTPGKGSGQYVLEMDINPNLPLCLAYRVMQYFLERVGAARVIGNSHTEHMHTQLCCDL